MQASAKPRDWDPEEHYPPLQPDRSQSNHYVVPPATMLTAFPTAKFYSRFRPGHWLHDAAIESYLYLVECRANTPANNAPNHSGSSAKVIVGPTVIGQILTSKYQQGAHYLGAVDGSPSQLPYFEQVSKYFYSVLN